VTFKAIISGSGNLVQNGSGTTILGGANTYAGGTIINSGTLLVNNSQALGRGNVVVSGGVLGADPQPINVKGNYTQNAGGTLQLQVAGAGPGQYDTLNVGENATLGGSLQLISLGYQPRAGQELILVTTGEVVSGRFAQFIDPFATGPAFTTVDLVYERDLVLLEFLNMDFAAFAHTPNQLAAANLLDAVEMDPRAADLISFLDNEPFANLPGDLDKISPDSLTAFYEISFSNANIQKLSLEGRLDDIHNGSTGFSSNMKVNSATVNLEGKASVDGKSSQNVVEPILQPGPENRWGVWVTGFGDFVNVDGDGNGKDESSRAGLRGLATDGTGGAEWSTFISGGYDLHCGHLTAGPIGSLQYTYVNIDSFSEQGSLAPMQIHTGSAESLRTDFGFRAFYQWQIGKVLVEPSLKAAWEHEYKYSALPITAGFAGIPGPSDTFYGPSEGHDSAIVSAGMSVQWSPMIATYVDYDGQFGRSYYDSNAVTGGVRFSF